tara:strand:- start:4714 stop:5043 length:330 start_codon:yes stop_codon:yes gene_type:complete
MADKRTKAELLTEIAELKEEVLFEKALLRNKCIEWIDQENISNHFKSEADRLCQLSNKLEQEVNKAREQRGDTLHTSQTALRCIMEVMAARCPTLDEYPTHTVSNWSPF